MRLPVTVEPWLDLDFFRKFDWTIPSFTIVPYFITQAVFSFANLNGIREYISLLNTTLELDTSGRLRAVMARARADQDIAAASLGIAQRDLRRLVTAAFIQLQLSRHLVEAARNTLAEAKSFEARTELLFKKGEAAEGDLIKASAQVAFLEQALSAAELQAQLCQSCSRLVLDTRCQHTFSLERCAGSACASSS